MQMAIISAYAMGGVVVGVLYEAVGWGWTNSVSVLATGLAAFYVTMFSAPAMNSGPRPKPQGMWTALRTSEFVAHAATAFMCGYIMNEQSVPLHHMPAYLLPTTYYLLPKLTSYYLLPTTHYPLPTAVFMFVLLLKERFLYSSRATGLGTKP